MLIFTIVIAKPTGLWQSNHIVIAKPTGLWQSNHIVIAKPTGLWQSKRVSAQDSHVTYSGVILPLVVDSHVTYSGVILPLVVDSHVTYSGVILPLVVDSHVTAFLGMTLGNFKTHFSFLPKLFYKKTTDFALFCRIISNR